ncbi:hypothetical protein VN23_02570 [Janthinobacterium sp. B9-8]|nr:hypothetical protein VN23_02570 [Janthinobacterium sp. B9-8]
MLSIAIGSNITRLKNEKYLLTLITKNNTARNVLEGRRNEAILVRKTQYQHLYQPDQIDPSPQSINRYADIK